MIFVYNAPLVQAVYSEQIDTHHCTEWAMLPVLAGIPSQQTRKPTIDTINHPTFTCTLPVQMHTFHILIGVFRRQRIRGERVRGGGRGGGRGKCFIHLGRFAIHQPEPVTTDNLSCSQRISILSFDVHQDEPEDVSNSTDTFSSASCREYG